MESNINKIKRNKNYKIIEECAIGIYILIYLSEDNLEVTSDRKKNLIREVESIYKKYNDIANDDKYIDMIKSINDYFNHIENSEMNFRTLQKRAKKELLAIKDLIKSIDFYLSLDDLENYEYLYLKKLKNYLKDLNDKCFNILIEIIIDFLDLDLDLGFLNLKDLKVYVDEYLSNNKNIEKIFEQQRKVNIDEIIQSIGYTKIDFAEKYLEGLFDDNGDTLISLIDRNLNKFSKKEALFFNSSYDSAINFISKLNDNVVLNNKLFKKLIEKGFYNPTKNKYIQGLDLFDFKEITENHYTYANKFLKKNQGIVLNIEKILFINGIPVIYIFKKNKDLRFTYDYIMDMIDSFPEYFTFIQNIIIYDENNLYLGGLFDDVDDYILINEEESDEFLSNKNILNNLFKIQKDYSGEDENLSLKEVLYSFAINKIKTISNIINYNLNKFLVYDDLNIINCYELTSNFIHIIKHKNYRNFLDCDIFTKELNSEKLKIFDPVFLESNELEILKKVKLNLRDQQLFFDAVIFINNIPVLLYKEINNDIKEIFDYFKIIKESDSLKLLQHIIVNNYENYYYGNIYENFNDYFSLNNILKKNFNNIDDFLNNCFVIRDLIFGKYTEKSEEKDYLKRIREEKINNKFVNNKEEVKNNYKFSSENDIKDEKYDYLDFLDEEEDLTLDEILNSDEFKKDLESVVEKADYKHNKEYIKNISENNSKEDMKNLILANERLVTKYANIYLKTYSPKGLDLEDLIQFGYIGLIKAAEKFDLNMDNEFSTYAIYWIKQQINRAIADYGNTIRIPVHTFEKINKLRNLEKRCEKEFGFINYDYICEIMEEPIEKINEYRLYRYKFLNGPSLDNKVGEDKDTSLGDFIADNSTSMEDDFEYKDLHNQIQIILNKFSERERYVIICRFGLDGREPSTLEDLGKELGVTRERIRQIEKKVLNKLSKNKIIKEFKNYL